MRLLCMSAVIKGNWRPEPLQGGLAPGERPHANWQARRGRGSVQGVLTSLLHATGHVRMGLRFAPQAMDAVIRGKLFCMQCVMCTCVCALRRKPWMQSAKAAGNLSRSREGWCLGNALVQTGRLEEAEGVSAPLGTQKSSSGYH